MTADGFLARWSRLKRTEAARKSPVSTAGAEARADEAGGTARPEPGGPVATGAEPPADPVAEPGRAADRPLPSLDDLTSGSDLKAFFADHIPEDLRRAALRRMWSLEPSIRDYVPLADYAWDWNAPEGVPGFIGALRPGDDAVAFLRQAIGAMTPEPAAEADAAVVPATTRADEAPAASEGRADLAPAAPGAERAGAPEPLAAMPATDAPTPPDHHAVLAPPETALGMPAAPTMAPASARTAEAAAATGPGAAPAPLRRRHGGAMPA